MSRRKSNNPSSNSNFSREIIFNNRDAVIFIHSITKINNGKNIQNCSNGFFIKNYFIICPSEVVTINNKDIFDKILVTISNVSQSGKSYCYIASVVGVDASSNIAVLYINFDNEWNKHNPNINSHSYLKWSKSRNLSSTDVIYVIGNINNISKHSKETSENGALVGNIVNNRFVDPDGLIPCELLLLNNILTSGRNCGLPVLDQYGGIVGMTTYHQRYKNIAISEFFMRKPIRRLIQSFKKDVIESPYIIKMSHSYESSYEWYMHNKSWVGIAGRQMNSLDYFNETINKEIVGYYVTSKNEYFEIGDIVVSIDECPLGSRKGQISPALIMYRTPPGSSIKVIYKKLSEHYNEIHEINIITKSYPDILNYPWYCYDVLRRKNLF